MDQDESSWLSRILRCVLESRIPDLLITGQQKLEDVLNEHGFVETFSLAAREVAIHLASVTRCFYRGHQEAYSEILERSKTKK